MKNSVVILNLIFFQIFQFCITQKGDVWYVKTNSSSHHSLLSLSYNGSEWLPNSLEQHESKL